MAVAFDAVSSTSWSGTGVSFSHTCAGSDRYLAVIIGQINSIPDISMVSYGGVALTELTDMSHANDGDTANIWVWELIAPASGSNTVSISSSNHAGFKVATMSFTGVDQTTPKSGGSSDTDNNSGYALSFTQATNGLIFGGALCTAGGNWHTHDADDTERYDNGGLVAFTNNGTDSPETPNGSNTDAWPVVAYGGSLQPPQSLTIDMTGSEAIVVASALIGAVIEGTDVTIIGRTASVVVSASVGAVVIEEPLRGELMLVT